MAFLQCTRLLTCLKIGSETLRDLTALTAWKVLFKEGAQRTVLKNSIANTKDSNLPVRSK